MALPSSVWIVASNKASALCVRVSVWPLHGKWVDVAYHKISKGCLTVLMTSLSVLTTEGWMMVAPQGTATTGGQTETTEGFVHSYV